MFDDDFLMRAQLQRVIAYRDLCRQVRRSGRENVYFALLMLFLAYLVMPQGGVVDVIFLIYVALALGEFGVGFFKFIRPSAEGILLDALVLLAFAVFNFGITGIRMAGGMGASPFGIIFGVFMLMQSINRFKLYGTLRVLFAERPSADQIAWVEDLAREIRHADPETDDLALDLPTTPHWKAKMLGKSVFFVSEIGGALQLAGPFDFQLERERKDHGTGRRRARLSIHGTDYPDFQIDDASWENYRKWLATHVPPQARIEPT